jgi:hypothetical protein
MRGNGENVDYSVSHVQWGIATKRIGPIPDSDCDTDPEELEFCLLIADKLKC